MSGIELKPMQDAVNKFDFLGVKTHMQNIRNGATNSEQTPIYHQVDTNSPPGSPDKIEDAESGQMPSSPSAIKNYHSSGNSFHSANSKTSIGREASGDSTKSSLHPLLEGLVVDFKKMDASPKFILFWMVVNALACFYLVSFSSFMNGHLNDYESRIESYCNPLHMSHEFCVGEMWQNIFFDDISIKVRPRDDDADMVEQKTSFCAKL
jgi:hypothetical protein